MTIANQYKDAFSEVYTILGFLEDEELKKIPSNVISAIENNRNLNYIYEMNEDVDLFKQPMLLETKAILFNLYRDYLATPEQRKKIIKIQNEERQRKDKEKREKHNPNGIFENRQSNFKNVPENKSIIEVKKENFIEKIIRKIKSKFNK